MLIVRIIDLHTYFTERKSRKTYFWNRVDSRYILIDIRGVFSYLKFYISMFRWMKINENINKIAWWLCLKNIWPCAIVYMRIKLCM